LLIKTESKLSPIRFEEVEEGKDRKGKHWKFDGWYFQCTLRFDYKSYLLSQAQHDRGLWNDG
jgi:hypothetical protein